MADRADTQAQPAIECRGLTKRYPSGFLALRDLSLAIPSGASFGLLGENGAGKSTLVRLALGFIAPSAGTLRVLGERDPAHAHPRIGYLHERPVFEPRFSGREHLRFLAALGGFHGAAAEQRIASALATVQLTDAADRRCGAYSKGMLQRLAIAHALLADPTLLILDEPTSGLDPLAQYEVRQIIKDLHQRGKTILLCSHYLAEVEALCESVGILRRGRLVRHGAVADLLRRGETVEIELAGSEPAAVLATRLGLDAHVTAAEGQRLRVRAQSQAEVLAALVAAGVALRSLNPIGETLEDLYVRVEAEAAEAARAAASVSAGMLSASAQGEWPG